jgi:signal recognition particle subunit SRP54
VIVTKLDGHAKGGGAISAVAATDSPIVFLGSGEHFDDFEPFNAKSFVSKLLGFGDIKGFMEELDGVVDKKRRAEIQKNLSKGKYTLRDLYTQFDSMNKLGGMGKAMSSMGMGNMGGMAGASDAIFGKMRFMMDSMKDEELDGVVDLQAVGEDRDKRIVRIAR